MASFESKKSLSWSKRARIAMIEKGISVNELAKMVNRTRSYVSAVINGRVFSAPVNKMISDVLNIEYEEVDR